VSSILIKPQNFPETLVWYYIICTYPIYFLGAQFVLAPLLASCLVVYLLIKWWNQTENTPKAEKITISITAWVWVGAVIVIEVALIVNHIILEFETRRIITSSLLWYRTWGLFALFPLAGHLNIRPKLIYRAVCILCLQSLVVVIIGVIAGFLHLPSISYISPLKAVGGDEEMYLVKFFHTLRDRLELFAIWPTILALAASIYFCFALQETDKKWRCIGLFTSIFMILAAQARTATVGLPFVLGLVWFLTNFVRPWVQFATGFMSLLMGMFAPIVIDFLKVFKEQFDKLRSGSSKVRAAIYRISLERWWNESPIWGLAVRERGPEVIVNLPLGSHHTWFGTLYSYGIVGCAALAVAFLWSFFDLLIKAQTSEDAKVGLQVLLVMLICSFADNLETFAFTYWPGWLILGIAFKQSSSCNSISENEMKSFIH
jgi:hypothetical protein